MADHHLFGARRVRAGLGASFVLALVMLGACTHDFGVFAVSDAAAGDGAAGTDSGPADVGADGGADGAADARTMDAGMDADASACKRRQSPCATTAECCAGLRCQDNNGLKCQ